MIVAEPVVSREDTRRILEALAAKGYSIPEPQAVEVVATEDHDGDPVFIMTVTFPAGARPEDPSWSTISPLVSALRKLVFGRGGENRPVIAEICRLGESAGA
ncbi:MAG TPA: hypothetical protein PLA50_05820 [Bacteroidia bacterium]|nr:hypothetical protein [Bacteroidia bacterium]